MSILVTGAGFIGLHLWQTTSVDLLFFPIENFWIFLKKILIISQFLLIASLQPGLGEAKAEMGF